MATDDLMKKVTSYNDYFDEVVEWNQVCEDAPPNLENQWKLVVEEAAELYEAFDEGNHLSFFKELADLFVVSSYAAVIVYPATEALTHYQDDIEYLLGKLEDQIDEGNVLKTFDVVLQIMNSVNQEALEKTMHAVLRSNWSKIFPETEAEQELKFAAVGYTNRYSGIYVQTKPDGCVLKDSNNKVLKPSSYASYEEYM
jgi:hypothetical protein